MSTDVGYKPVDRRPGTADDLANERDLSRHAELQSFFYRIRTLADGIRIASYGYAGIDSNKRVDAIGLNRLRYFDLPCRGEIESLVAEIDPLTAVNPLDADGIRAV